MSQSRPGIVTSLRLHNQSKKEQDNIDDGGLYKNITNTTLYVSDTANIEIPPDGLIKMSDYPMLKDSVHFRRFIAMNFLIQDPSKGREIGSDEPPKVRAHMVSSDVKLNDDQIDNITDKLIEKMMPVLTALQKENASTTIPDKTPQSIDKSNEERADIIMNVVERASRPKERFGEIQETDSSEDVSGVADNINKIGDNSAKNEW